MHMFRTLIAGAVLMGSALVPAAAMAGTVVHRTEIPHATMPVKATYSTQWSVTTREVSPPHATRQIMPTCHWRADVVVARAVEGPKGAIAALARPVHQLGSASGIEAGRCAYQQERIAAQVARHAEKHAAHGTRVAEQDRGALVNELEGLARTVGQTG
jgi:hypothetical protein